MFNAAVRFLSSRLRRVNTVAGHLRLISASPNPAFRILGGANPLPPRVKSKARKKPESSVDLATIQLKKLSIFNFISSAIGYWQEHKGVVGDKPVIRADIFETWRDQVIIQFADYITHVDHFESLDNKSLTIAVEKIMTEQALKFVGDCVEFLCPTVPKIGFRHKIEQLHVELVERRLTADSPQKLDLILTWRSIQDPESMVETFAELTEEDVIWPGTIKELAWYLSKNQLNRTNTRP